MDSVFSHAYQITKQSHDNTVLRFDLSNQDLLGSVAIIYQKKVKTFCGIKLSLLKKLNHRDSFASLGLAGVAGDCFIVRTHSSFFTFVPRKLLITLL